MLSTTLNIIEISELAFTEHNKHHSDPTPTRIGFRISDHHTVITNHFVAPNVHISSFSHNFEPKENRLVCFAKIAVYLTKIRIFPYNSIQKFFSTLSRVSRMRSK